MGFELVDTKLDSVCMTSPCCGRAVASEGRTSTAALLCVYMCRLRICRDALDGQLDDGSLGCETWTAMSIAELCMSRKIRNGVLMLPGGHGKICRAATKGQIEEQPSISDQPMTDLADCPR